MPMGRDAAGGRTGQQREAPRVPVQGRHGSHTGRWLLAQGRRGARPIAAGSPPVPLVLVVAVLRGHSQDPCTAPTLFLPSHKSTNAWLLQHVENALSTTHLSCSPPALCGGWGQEALNTIPYEPCLFH